MKLPQLIFSTFTIILLVGKDRDMANFMSKRNNSHVMRPVYTPCVTCAPWGSFTRGGTSLLNPAQVP